METEKKFWQSKTFWLNVIALIVALIQAFVGPLPAVDPQQFGAAVAALNLALRFVTKLPVKF